MMDEFDDLLMVTPNTICGLTLPIMNIPAKLGEYFEDTNVDSFVDNLDDWD